MPVLLTFSDQSSELWVRSFVWVERIGHAYEVQIEAVTPEAQGAHDLLGRPATLTISGPGSERVIRGIVQSIEQRVTEANETVAVVRLGSVLAPLAHRQDTRIFEHVSTLDIAGSVLRAWNLEASLRCTRDDHPPREFRVQYGESDLTFLRRILEEEGISLLVVPNDANGSGGDAIVLDDAPNLRESTLSLAQADDLPRAVIPAYAKLASRHEIAPSALVLLDHDFTLRNEVDLTARAETKAIHPPIATHAVEHGAFEVDGAKPADGSKTTQARGALTAERRLAARRADASTVTFITNAASLYAGAIVQLSGLEMPVLVTSLRIIGNAEGTIEARVEGVMSASTFRPKLETPRPIVQGVHTARVTGPEGESIHVDSRGRVRVELVWDRREREQRSSCWVRVSQSWAGPGLGLVTIPRIGQDVLLGFLDGDPDRPFVVGRLFDGSSPHPYPLPENATKTALRTQSVPNGEGYNELSFEDALGRELVYTRAERDRESFVRQNDRLRIDGDRQKKIGANESIQVKGSRTARIGVVDVTEVGSRFTASIAGGSTYLDMSDGKIRMTTGAASFDLDGPNARISAEGSVDVTAAEVVLRGRTTIRVEAGAEIHIESANGNIVIQGGPMVYINPGDPTVTAENDGLALPVEAPHDVDIVENIEDARDAQGFDPEHPEGIGEKLAPGKEWDYLGRGEEWRAFHFFHAAVVSSAAGQPLGVLLRQEGQRQVARFGADPKKGDPGNGLTGGKAPYGLDPKDRETIENGVKWYHSEFGAESQ